MWGEGKVGIEPGPFVCVERGERGQDFCTWRKRERRRPGDEQALRLGLARYCTHLQYAAVYTVNWPRLKYPSQLAGLMTRIN